MGTQLSLLQSGIASQFSAHVCCGQTARRIMPLGMEVGLGPGHIVLIHRIHRIHRRQHAFTDDTGMSKHRLSPLDGDQARPRTGSRHSTSHLSAHVHYGQTAGWIKMPLSTKVGFGPGHILCWTLPQKGAQPPIFGPCMLWSNGWMDQDATWYGGRP